MPPIQDSVDNALSVVLAAALESCQEVLQSNLPRTSTATIEQLDNLLSNIQVDTRSTLNNRRSSVSKLPTETLILSLQYVLDAVSRSAAPEEMVWRSGFNTSPILRTLSRVSRVWRHLILDLPSVWTVITDQHPDAFLAFVERSQNRPIAVHLGLSERERGYPDLVLQLPLLQWRLSELYWTTRRPEVRKADVLTFPAPILEVLYIRDDYAEEMEMDVDDDDIVSGPPPVLFADCIPNLYRVHLAVVGWLPGNYFESLTHLCLDEIFHPVVFSDMIDLLRRCPLLEHLVFINIVVAYQYDPHPLPLPTPHDPALLPNLRRLSFDYTATDVVNDYLRFIGPLRSDVALQVRHIPCEYDTPLTSVRLARFAPALCGPLTHLAYVRPHWHSHVNIAACGPHSALRLDTVALAINDKHWSARRPYVWAAEQLTALRLTHVEVFYLGFLSAPRAMGPGTQIMRYIMALPQLQQLVIWTDDLSMLLNGLYNGHILAWGGGVNAWTLKQLDIVVVPDRQGAQDNTTEPFDGAVPHPPGRLSIERVYIHSPLDKANFRGPIGALRTLTPRVRYLQGSRGPVMPFPEVCHEPDANTEWTGAAWNFPN